MRVRKILDFANHGMKENTKILKFCENYFIFWQNRTIFVCVAGVPALLFQSPDKVI